MVSLSTVHASNASLPPNLVAVFTGATAGIGEATIKQLALHAPTPRAYLIGRSLSAGARIVAECRTLNPNGEFIFIPADLSLIRNVDEVVSDIQKREKYINILFMSHGAAIMDRRLTEEKLHLLTALTFYSRLRLATSLLPLIQKAPTLRRVVTVAGGTNEGPIFPNDFPALKIPLKSLRGHLTTLISLSLEVLARKAPEVGFIHDYPGSVDTELLQRMEGFMGVVMRMYFWLAGRWICVPLKECGERHLWLATSGRFPGRGEAEGKDGARGSDGVVGSGVYSVGWDGESAGDKVVELLAKYREEGMVERVWEHAEGEFKRITRQN